jgi:hypothetical protein
MANSTHDEQKSFLRQRDCASVRGQILLLSNSLSAGLLNADVTAKMSRPRGAMEAASSSGLLRMRLLL